MMNRILIGFAFGLLGSGLFAEESLEMELDRQTPVAPDSPIPVTDFFRPVYMTRPTLNRSGTHIAAMVSGGSDRYQLMVIDRAEGTHDTISGKAHMDVLNPRWLADDRVSYLLSAEKLYGLALMVAPINRLNRSYPIYQYGGAQIIGVPQDNPMRPSIWLRSDDRGIRGGVLELDARRKGGSLINLWNDRRRPGGWAEVQEMNSKSARKAYPVPAHGQAFDYLADRDGNLAYAMTVEDGVGWIHYWTGEEWIKSSLDTDKWKLSSVGNRPYEIVVRNDRSEGAPGALYFADVKTGEVGAMIFQDSDYDVWGAFFRDPQSRNLVGFRYDQAGPRTVWFDEKYQALQKTLDASFPGQVVRIVEGNEAATVFLLSVSSDRQSSSFYVIDSVKRSLDLVAASRPWLDPERMQPRRIMKFETAEGHPLDAYFTLPAGATTENPPPLVVIPHDGPWRRDRWHFNAEAQFLASRGYAVLQPNYRGSSGYNWMFPFEDRWDFVKMHEDVTRAAQTLIASGRVDGGRVAIAGSAFGGYLALMGAVHEPDLYKCAITFAGISDWEDHINAKAQVKHEYPDFQVLVRYLGDPSASPELFERISPLRRADEIEIPILVAHGKEDRVVSVQQSHRLIAELKRHGVEHESLLLSGEGHGTYQVENSVEYYAAMEAFLGKHLKPEDS